MKQQIEFLINTLFWEKYIDVVSEANFKELTTDFLIYIQPKVPSAKITIWKEALPSLHTVVFKVVGLKIKIE